MWNSSIISGAKTRKRIKAATAPLLVLALHTASSCHDNTASLGIYSEPDGITNSTGIFQVTTRSLALDSVVATSTTSSLGDITDPETGAALKADFAAQFYTFEDYAFPDLSLMVGNDSQGQTARGIAQCDSVEVRLYFDSYYGDDNNPMKLQVFKLSADKLLSEEATYYTNLDLTSLLDDGSQPLCSRVFTPMDYNLDATELTSSSHSHNVHVMLPASLGQEIMDAYYRDPQNFKDSYAFIHNVLPGLYFTTANTQGTMLTVYVGTLNI